MEEIADGVWQLRGDLRKGMSIYFLRDGDGVIQFDAATKAMTKQAKAAAEELGGLKRVVLGHAHADHRGTAPYMEAPVFCHTDAVAEAESPESIPPYFELDRVPFAPLRWLYPTMLRHWDGGAVGIEGTLSEGDNVAGFTVVDVPGHAPGQIVLWRESDGVALTSDTVYLVETVTRRVGSPLRGGGASIPHPLFAIDHELSRRSVRKLAALEPSLVAAGHGEPLRGENLRQTLEQAAEKL